MYGNERRMSKMRADPMHAVRVAQRLQRMRNSAKFRVYRAARDKRRNQMMMSDPARFARIMTRYQQFRTRRAGRQ